LAGRLGNGATTSAASTLNGPIALILPLGVEAFYPVADAIERGFETAEALDGNKTEVKIYATSGNAGEITGVYQQALAEGAQYVVGPVTEAEVSSLAANAPGVTTLALNRPDHVQTPDNKLFAFGLSISDEARQLASIAHKQGMQTANIIATSSGLSKLMADAFRNAWEAEGGQVVQQIDVVEGTSLDGLKSTMATYPADFILLAANGEEARKIRPNLDIATPTFGFSHIYDGLAYDPANAALSAVQFVDLPWVLKPDSPAFAGYREAAAELPRGEMQRWFALGADAYRILQVLARQPLQATVINGLTGKIHISSTGEITRELALARFSPAGILVDHLP
jgi:outer membrane PBP1 activator LpoA protein